MVRVEQIAASEWERARDVRLRALQDVPNAFCATYERERELAPEDWQARLKNPGAATFIASDGEHDVGLVVGAEADHWPDAVGLFALWVAPEHRGLKIADQLVVQVVSWARARGYPRVLLDVADDNFAAIRLYERHGFAPTGARGGFPPPRDYIVEHERALDL